MSEIEKKAKEIYPEEINWDYRDVDFDPNSEKRTAWMNGYRRAMEEMWKKLNDVDEIPLEIRKVISDNFWEML